MPILDLTPDKLIRAAADLGLLISGHEADSYSRILAPWVSAYKALDAIPDSPPRPIYPRPPGYRPEGEANKYNAWYYRTSIKGAPEGKLKGKTVALKDNIMLAGAPMMNGASTLQGYICDRDATVVTRILDAGGEIAGKAHCEWFCMAASSFTNALGPVHNPFKMDYSAGGSSSGCAVAVAVGDVDMAIGCDQGGSIRIPSSFCGICGMKPTHGLVPYTGILSLDPQIDHVGPMTKSVRDNALLLEVIAGPDGYDSRQKMVVTHPYSQMLDGGVAGLRIGVLREGFGHPNSEADVDAKVRTAARLFKKMGAAVEEVSAPLHLMAGAIFTPIAVEGALHTLAAGDSVGIGRPDVYATSLMDYHRDWARHLDAMPPLLKAFIMLGKCMQKDFGHRYYGKASNLIPTLTVAYDAVLKVYDLLLMPTTPIKASKLPSLGASLEERAERSVDMVANTLPFDLTHHPAMNVPCGMSDGLPVGMMLVGRCHAEPTIYRAAYAFEQAHDWKAA